MEPLEAVNQHRAVGVVENVLTNFDDAVGSDADQVLVEGRVMEPAQSNAVRHGRLAERVGVGQDVRGLDQLHALETTDRAVMLVGADYPFAECCLMKALSKEPRRVPPSDRRFLDLDVAEAGERAFVHADRERQQRRSVPDDEDGPLRRTGRARCRGSR